MSESNNTDLKDYISIIWCIQDVQSRAEDEESEHHPISDEDARMILNACEYSHDCNYGLTWEHIDQATEQHFSKPHTK